MLVAILAVASLAPTVAPQEAPPPSSIRWYGPTGMLEGWHVRVPVAVQNPLDRAVVDAVVGHDVRLGDVLLQLGWASSNQGGSPRLESFVLDEHSVRVVEYRDLANATVLGGQPIGEVTSVVSLGLREGTRPYHNRTQPDVHVEWKVPGRFEPGATRYFVIYADTLTNGAKEPAGYSEADRAPIDGRHWISRGTTLVGAARRVTILGLHEDTNVTVEVLSGGRFAPAQLGGYETLLVGTGAVPLSPGGGPLKNPLVMDAGEIASFTLSNHPILVRLRADKPVVALGTPSGDPHALAGPVPSADGGLAGTTFILPSYGWGYLVVSPGNEATVTLNGVETRNVSPGSPIGAYQIIDGERRHSTAVHTIRATAPVMVLAWPSSESKSQLPTAWGAPAGSRLVGLPHEGLFCGPNDTNNPEKKDCVHRPLVPCTVGNLAFEARGQLIVASTGARAHALGRDLLSLAPQYPRVASGEPSGLPVEVPANGAVRITTVVEDRERNACPLLVHATPGASDAGFAGTGNLTAFGGPAVGSPALDHVTTPVGGTRGLDFLTFWRANVTAFHDGTEVTVQPAGGAPTTRGLGEGDVMEVAASFEQPARILASKPVAVVSSLADGGFFAGVDDSLRVTPIAQPAYRGYLVSLAPAGDGSEPLVGVAAPGKPVSHKLLVTNLARDHAGRPVRDSVRLSVDAPVAGWTATVSPAVVDLAGGETREVEVVVTPPADAAEGAPLRLRARATSVGNPAMADSVSTITIARAAYGVDLWFEREDGLKSRTLTLDSGQTQKVRLVVKNTASIPDRVAVASLALSPDWKAELGDRRLPLLELDMAAGEKRELDLYVQAPDVAASQSLVEVSASSLSDAAVAAKVSATARIRADVRIALVVPNATGEAAPGGEIRFPATFLNRGNDRVGIRLNTTGALPDGWSRPLIYQGGYAIDELTGIQPGAEVAIEVVVKLPANATRGQRASLLLYAETIPQFIGDPVLRETADLLALAAARHDLRPAATAALVPADDAMQATARLTLQNLGNGPERLRVVPETLPEGASFAPGAPVTIPSPGNGTVELALRLPAGAPAGPHAVAARIVADDGFSIPWRFNVSVPETARVEILPMGPMTGVVGSYAKVPVQVANVGNVPLRLPPPLRAPDGWDVRVEAGAGGGLLEPGAVVVAELVVRAPAEAPAATQALAVDPSWAAAEPLSWDARTVALAAEVDERSEDLVIRLRNDGTGDALGVETVVMRDGVVVDRSVLPRLPAGGSAEVLLARPAGAGDAVVRVDNASAYGEPIDLAVVAKTTGVPGPSVPLALAAAGAALLARRRAPRV